MLEHFPLKPIITSAKYLVEYTEYFTRAVKYSLRKLIHGLQIEICISFFLACVWPYTATSLMIRLFSVGVFWKVWVSQPHVVEAEFKVVLQLKGLRLQMH